MLISVVDINDERNGNREVGSVQILDGELTCCLARDGVASAGGNLNTILLKLIINNGVLLEFDRNLQQSGGGVHERRRVGRRVKLGMRG